MQALKGLYHADKLDAKTFVDNFIIRLKEYKAIIDNLKQQKKKPLQHFLITGKRGLGKSTLLRRIFIEAESGPSLNKKMFAVRLGSEQYRLSRLFKLWEITIEQLGKNNPELLKQKHKLSISKDYEENLVHIINDLLVQTGKTLLLLIDNFDEFIDKIPAKDQHALREALILYPIQIIGNSVFYDDHFKSYDKPFFDFFKPVHLQNLDKKEAEEFIKLRAASEGIENFEQIYKGQKGKIDTLRILSGGVPRTLLILLSIVSKKNTGDAVDYLQEMIEQVTPLYQDRMKALSPQQQEIMHHLAMNWDRTPVKILADEMRLPSKTVSAQLTQLESSGYINKIDIPGRNHYYEIDERFFNIWLLMSEAAPHDVKRVIWLTRWLDVFYSNHELEDFAIFCNDGLTEAKADNRFLIAQALSSSEKLSEKSKKFIVEKTLSDLMDKVPEVKVWADDYQKNLIKKEEKLTNEIFDYIEEKKYSLAIVKLKKLEEINEGVAFYGMGIISFLSNDYPNTEKYYLMAVANDDTNAMYNLANFYGDIKKDYINAEKYYLMAVAKGQSLAMYNLANLYNNIKVDYINAEKYYLMAVDKGHTDAMFNVANLFKNKKQDYANAEKYYLMAVIKGDSSAMYNLALLYKNIKNDSQNAEKYYLMAVGKGHTSAMYNLALLYKNEKKDSKNTEKYYLLAVSKGHIAAMHNLANFYFTNNIDGQKLKALEFSKRYLDKGNKNIDGINLYVRLLLWNGKIKEANERMIAFLNSDIDTNDVIDIISNTLIYFLVFKQKQILYSLFNGTSNLIDKYKPVYYALLHQMQDKYLKEYLRMPEELQEPIEMILSFVKKEQERLGLS
ncbi:MAG: tetratricopeptide repeat protein [Ferruginibacter sp.]